MATLVSATETFMKIGRFARYKSTEFALEIVLHIEENGVFLI